MKYLISQQKYLTLIQALQRQIVTASSPNYRTFRRPLIKDKKVLHIHKSQQTTKSTDFSKIAI